MGCSCISQIDNQSETITGKPMLIKPIIKSPKRKPSIKLEKKDLILQSKNFKEKYEICGKIGSGSIMRGICNLLYCQR